MSLMQRAMEKAEREGRLSSWAPTRREAVHSSRPMTGDAPIPPIADQFVPLAESGSASTSISPLLVIATAPHSPAAEQFRLLRSRVEALSADKRTQVIVVSSPRLGDGKTTTSANLAMSMAQDPQQSVVLIEADLRRSRLAAMFDLRPSHGLVDVLLGTVTIEQALVRIPASRLVLLPAGVAPSRASNRLASSRLREVIDRLRERFTRVLVDTAPLALADTHELARIADGVLLVARAGLTPRPALDRALTALERDKVLGFVLNDVADAPDHYGYPYAEPTTLER